MRIRRRFTSSLRIDERLQIGQRILDFATFVELGAADELIRLIRVDQRLFERAGLGVGAVHDRHVGVGDARFGVQARDFGGHPLGLLLALSAA